MTAPRHCLVCGALSTGSRCPDHDHRARGTTARGYGAAYQRQRRAVLAGNPRCWHLGCNSPATTTDHVPPLRSVLDPADWRGELRPACAPHNYNWSNQ